MTQSLVNSQALNTRSLHQCLSMRSLYLFVCFFLLEVTARISRIQTGLASLWDLITRHNWRRCTEIQDVCVVKCPCRCPCRWPCRPALQYNEVNSVHLQRCSHKQGLLALCTYPPYPQTRVLTFLQHPVSFGTSIAGNCSCRMAPGCQKGLKDYIRWEVSRVHFTCCFAFLSWIRTWPGMFPSTHVLHFLDFVCSNLQQVFGEVLQVFSDRLVFACCDATPSCSIWCAQVFEFSRG